MDAMPVRLQPSHGERNHRQLKNIHGKKFYQSLSLSVSSLVNDLQNAMLRPDDIETIMKRVQQKKVREEYEQL